MFKLFLISIVLVPVLLGLLAARRPSRRDGLLLLVTAVIGYDVLYLLVLYYVRIRWVGWGAG